jgi:hypothetical protein
MNEPVVNYWHEFYVNKGLCALCGNTGTVDTRATVRSAAGVKCGMFTYCICPNGQTLRERGSTKPLPIPTMRPEPEEDEMPW